MNSSRIGRSCAVAVALLGCLGSAPAAGPAANLGPALDVGPAPSALDVGPASLDAGHAAGRSTDLQQLAANYVDAYQKQLTAIVADEVYQQTILGQDPADEGAARSRTTRGEVFFLFAAAEREWMAIRDVREVDGAPVSGGADVRETLRTLAPGLVGERMKAYNARYNIGRVVRNINEPTLALLVLDGTHRSRFKFKSGRARMVGGRTLVPLTFRERERPTLIRSSTGAPIYTSGELLVEPDNGRVWQSTLDAAVDAIRVHLITEYSFDARLNLLLPTIFRERYEQGQAAGKDSGARRTAPYELIEAQGQYSNFRRFEVLSRVR